MSNRTSYDEELKTLNQDISSMANSAAEAVSRACALLTQKNAAEAGTIIEGDKNIDAQEQAIEHRCLVLLLRQQPVATDLRRVSTALKLVTDIERIGDHAADIAEISLMLEDDWQKKIPVLVDFESMEKASLEMIHNAIDAFMTVDSAKARAVTEMDDTVDNLFDKIKQELARYIVGHPDEIDAAMDLLMVNKYLERLGDHAVNIAQWVIFLESGMYRGQQIV